MCKMTEIKNRRDGDLEQSISSANALRNNFFRTKEEKLGPMSGTTAAVWYPAVLSPGVVASPGFPGRSSPPGFLLLLFLWCCSESDDSVI